MDGSIDIIQYEQAGFTDDYKEDAFTIWYEAGKPGASKLRELLPFPITNSGKKPSVVSVSKWIKFQFAERAEKLDSGVRETMDARLVESQIEMLSRHIGNAKEMQDIAMDYLRENKDELTPQSAVRLWVEGTRVEKDSSGIPEMLEKMSKLSDDDLYKEIEKIIEEGTIELEEE